MVGEKGPPPRRRNRQRHHAQHELHPRDAHPSLHGSAGAEDHEAPDRDDRGVATPAPVASAVADAKGGGGLGERASRPITIEWRGDMPIAQRHDLGSSGGTPALLASEPTM